MPDNASHGDGAVAPWWTKVEIELVVLYVWIPGDTSLPAHQLQSTTGEARMQLPYSPVLRSDVELQIWQ